MKFKTIFGALAALFCVAFVGLTVRGAKAVLEDGNRWPAPQYFDGKVNLNDGVIHTPVTKTAAFTVALTDNAYDLNSTAGAFLVSLPDATVAATTPADGQCWRFRLTVANGAVSLSPTAVGNLLDASQAAYAGMDAVGDSSEVCYDSGTGDYTFQSRYIH